MRIRVFYVVQFLAWLCILFELCGCSSTPGSLRRHASVAGELRRKNALSESLAQAVASPESAAGKTATGRFVELWCASGSPATVRVDGWTVHFKSEWKPAYFDALLPAVDYDVHGLKTRHVQEGKGVALIGCRKNTNRERVESLYPPEMITRPVTAFLKVERDRTATVELKNPWKHSELAADFTAPLAELLGRTATLGKLGFGGLMGSIEAKRRGHKLYLLEPYGPQKTPVIFVHGLLSTPLAWANLTNDLWGDAEFRRRFQIWHYHYPTSAPFLYSAKLFRQRIAEVRSELDPRGVHPASAQLDIVAHSMGGLLTRTLITDSGEVAWNRVFRVPPSSLRGSAADREEVDDILHWKARQDVRKVIFIAVPHRGSNMSREFVGRIGDLLTRLPSNFVGLYARLNRDNPEALQPMFRDALSRGRLTSIDTLSSKHPMLGPFNSLPIEPGVTVYSIIGNRGRKGPLERSSDGVVPYTSSHLDAAVSELIVPTDHGAYKDPAAVAEILRILKQR